MIDRDELDPAEGVEIDEPAPGDEGTDPSGAVAPDAASDTGTPEAEATEAATEAEAPQRSLVVVPARRALELFRSGVTSARSGVTTASGATVDRVGQAMEGVERTWSERPGARIRRIRRMASEPLPFVYDVHPEARSARPVDVGLEAIDVADIAGTAVGGGAQRGGDFLPLKPFRGGNWQARWQRLRRAHDLLETLPPIDVVKYGDRYWVEDGHNRVGLALYAGQEGIDANVVELVRPGEHRTEPILPLASTVAASRAVRTAGRGRTPSHVLAQEDAVSIEPPDVAE